MTADMTNRLNRREDVSRCDFAYVRLTDVCVKYPILTIFSYLLTFLLTYLLTYLLVLLVEIGRFVLSTDRLLFFSSAARCSDVLRRLAFNSELARAVPTSAASFCGQHFVDQILICKKKVETIYFLRE